MNASWWDATVVLSVFIAAAATDDAVAVAVSDVTDCCLTCLYSRLPVSDCFLSLFVWVSYTCSFSYTTSVRIWFLCVIAITRQCPSSSLSYSITSVTSLCSASSGGCQRDAARIYCTAPWLLSAGACCTARRAAIDRYLLLQDAQQQTRRPLLLLSIDGTHRLTDGRTLDRFIDPEP